MPKTGSRRFENLLRAFGIVGAGGGDELRFPLSGLISPIVSADDYDPAPMYGLSVFQPAVALNFAFVEVQARPWARLVALTSIFSDFALVRRSQFDPAGVPAVAPVPFSSDGTQPNFQIQQGVGLVSIPGVVLTSGGNFPPVTPIHWEGVLRFQGFALGAAMSVSGFFQEHRPV